MSDTDQGAAVDQTEGMATQSGDGGDPNAPGNAPAAADPTPAGPAHESAAWYQHPDGPLAGLAEWLGRIEAKVASYTQGGG